MRAPVSCLLVCVAVLSGCPEPKVDPPPPPEEVARCELDVLSQPELFGLAGEGARAVRLSSEADGIGGQFAAGRAGDFLLENDRIRVVVTRPRREIGHSPFGGVIVDADLRRAATEPGRDQLGKLAMFYAFGRGIEVERVEVLRDGSEGGPAVVAATGRDALNDYITLEETIEKQNLGLKLLLDPAAPLPLRATTYYVLSPGAQSVRIVTAFCNDGDRPVSFPVGEINAGGGTMDFFNPGQCRGGLGEADCLVDPSPWFGWQGDQVAYGYRSFSLEDGVTPDQNALIYLSGSAAIVAGTRDLSGLLNWVDPNAKERPGTFGIRAGQQRLYVRELAVGRHLGEVVSHFEASAATGTLAVTVTSGGAPVPGARIVVEDPSTGRLLAPLVADPQGAAAVKLAPRSYRVAAAAPGFALGTDVTVTVEPNAQVPVPLVLGETRALTVQVRDPSGAPLPAKVLLRCVPGPCAPRPSAYQRFMEAEAQADDLALVGYVPPYGTATFQVPPGSYDLIASRGPEFSLWPDTAPALGHPVELTTQRAAQVEAVLGRVVDTSGWVSADLHVHAVHSADASPRNEARVLAFAAEGVDVLVSTDHDFITDYAPIIEALGASGVLTSIIGEEISPSWAHHNAFPLTRDGSFNGGAVDWAGGGGPTLRPGQVYQQVRSRWPSALIQVNHARGNQGLFSNIKLDTLTGASHADPALLRMEPSAAATAFDTGLFSTGFDALEIQNGASPSFAALNDWMTFLSRGLVRTGTAVSDTHTAMAGPSGYGRTWVRVGEGPAARLPSALTARLKALQAVGSNGPFLKVTAQALDATGAPVGPAVGVGQLLKVSPPQMVRLTVTVQAPEWLRFDRLELYTHAGGREAWNGEPNGTWPASRISQQKALDPLALPLVPLPGGLRRVEVTHSFEVSPTADAWYVVVVRSVAGGDLFPLFARPACAEDGSCATRSARPFAFANPIFVDADGSGAYDDFPLKREQGLRAASPRPPPRAELQGVPTLEEAEAILRRILHSHRH